MKTKRNLFLPVIAIGAMLALFALAGCTSQSTNAKESETIPAEIVHDHVVELPTYTELDYEFGQKVLAESYDNWGGQCTAVANYTDDGTMLVGRNMDLPICKKSAYIVKTDVEGEYKTIGLTFFNAPILPDFDDVAENGVSADVVKFLPFLSCDVLNEKGLYIEANMRNGETWPTGDSKFSCSGTNPDSKERVNVMSLARLVGQHCATVDEAIDYVKTLDLYTQNGGHDAWNFCFMMADESGHHGVPEIARNKVVWNEDQPGQANFYINPEFAKDQQLGAGYGRYDLATKDLEKVQTPEQMFKQIDQVTYFQSYFPDTCKYDPRSEDVGEQPWWTSDYVLAEENRDEIMAAFHEDEKKISSMSREELEEENVYWESVFTEVVNCKEKTITVRFFEDDDRMSVISFDDLKKE